MTGNPDQIVTADMLPSDLLIDDAEYELIEAELATSPLLQLAFREALKVGKDNLDKAKVFKDLAVARCTIDKTKKELGIIGGSDQPAWVNDFRLEVPQA